MIEEAKELDNENTNGDFSKYSKCQCVDYLVSLNDPEEPFYSKEALDRHDLQIKHLLQGNLEYVKDYWMKK